MISLKTKRLPDAIEARGNLFFLDTDFRIWIDFPAIIAEALDGDETRYETLFVGNIPYFNEETLEALIGFYAEPREIPRSSGGEKALDYDIDADYIYAAFMQAYGIDLVEADMHWHKFLALLNGLPTGTMMTSIMEWRSYSGNSKDAGYSDYMELKRIWSLPSEYSEEEQQEIDEFNELFG